MSSCVHRSLQFWIPRVKSLMGAAWTSPDLIQNKTYLTGALVKALRSRMFLMFAHLDCQLDCGLFAPGKTIICRASLRTPNSSSRGRSVPPATLRRRFVVRRLCGFGCFSVSSASACSDTGAQSTAVSFHIPGETGQNRQGESLPGRRIDKSLA